MLCAFPVQGATHVIFSQIPLFIRISQQINSFQKKTTKKKTCKHQIIRLKRRFKLENTEVVSRCIRPLVTGVTFCSLHTVST